VLRSHLAEQTQGAPARVWEDEDAGALDGDDAEALEERRLEERRRLEGADAVRRQHREEEEGRQRSATMIQATYRGKQDRAVAAARAPKPREWRFAKSSVRSFTTQEGGHNSATFFVHRHEKLEIAEVSCHGSNPIPAPNPESDPSPNPDPDPDPTQPLPLPLTLPLTLTLTLSLTRSRARGGSCLLPPT
jgi:hypothetical protein